MAAPPLMPRWPHVQHREIPRQHLAIWSALTRASAASLARTEFRYRRWWLARMTTNGDCSGTFRTYFMAALLSALLEKIRVLRRELWKGGWIGANGDPQRLAQAPRLKKGRVGPESPAPLLELAPRTLLAGS